MSLEEDFLMRENREVKARLDRLEAALKEEGVLNHCDPAKGGCGCPYAATLEVCPQCGKAHADLADPKESEPVDYSSWKYPELQAEAKKRGLDSTGKQADLVARLREDDELADEEDED